MPAAARTAARRFLNGYLATVYGRASIDAIPASTPRLRQMIRRQGARVPPAQRMRHPRVTQLVLVAISARRLRGRATVDDGDLVPYRLAFTIQRDRSGRWLASSIGE